MKIFGLIIVLIISGGLILSQNSSLGSKPSANYRKRFSSSKQFNNKTDVFQNRRPKLLKESQKKLKVWSFLRKLFRNDNDNIPKNKLSEIKPDLVRFLKDDSELKTIWLGHSTFLLNMNGKIILIDPIFSEYAAPFNLWIKRFQDPILKLEELPEIDYILISHDHYDHLDMDSIKYFKNLKTKFITPLGVGSHLESWGISSKRITEKDWWEVADMGQIKFIATPAQHFSGRSFTDQNSTLWASWVIQSKDHNVYFSGDGGYDSHFKKIGNKYGPFDVAFIESGQYNKSWGPVHLMPEMFVQTYKDLKAKQYFPIHWGMFKLALHPWYEPIEILSNLSNKGELQLLAPQIGQVLNIKNPAPLELWWERNR